MHADVIIKLSRNAHYMDWLHGNLHICWPSPHYLCRCKCHAVYRVIDFLNTCIRCHSEGHVHSSYTKSLKWYNYWTNRIGASESINRFCQDNTIQIWHSYTLFDQCYNKSVSYAYKAMSGTNIEVFQQSVQNFLVVLYIYIHISLPYAQLTPCHPYRIISNFQFHVTHNP